ANVFSDIFYKASTAREKGAAALILVTGYRDSDEKERAEVMSFAQGSRISARMPVIHVTTPAAEQWFSHTGVSLKARQEAIDAGLKPASADLPGARVQLGVDVVREKGLTENVIGILPGTDE